MESLKKISLINDLIPDPLENILKNLIIRLNALSNNLKNGSQPFLNFLTPKNNHKPVAFHHTNRPYSQTISHSNNLKTELSIQKNICLLVKQNNSTI